MAYSVNWNTKVITIPKTDTELVSSSPDVRKLSATTLWETLRSIEDDEAGMNFVAIVRNITPVTVAGVTLARVVEIINGYTLTFEDGQYTVNIYGGNSNVADVTNKNQVSVNTANSAGAIQIGGGAGDPWSVPVPGAYAAGTAGEILGNLPAAVAIAANNAVDAATGEFMDNRLIEGSLTMSQAMRIVLASLSGKCRRVGDVYYFRDIADTKDRITATVDGQNRIAITLDSV